MNKPFEKQRRIVGDSILASELETENSDQNWTLEPSQQRANKKFINKNSTMTNNRLQFTASDIFEKLDESVSENTAIERNPIEASATSTHISKIATELRSTQKSKGELTQHI